jgi:AbrB family looped-hinge helix DNA binding protein
MIGMKNMNYMTELVKGKHFYGAVSVGERGQVVIPKEAREQFCIKPGDKLVVLGNAGRGILLVKVDMLRKFAEGVLKKI